MHARQMLFYGATPPAIYELTYLLIDAITDYHKFSGLKQLI